MTTYGNPNIIDINYYYEGKNIKISTMIESVKFPDIPFTSEFRFEQYTMSYGVTPAYWDYLTILYLFVNPEEIKKFISQNNDDLKILLVYVPIFVQKQFPGDTICLEVIEDPDVDKKILKANIITSLSPTVAVEKLDWIDDHTADLETNETLDNFLLDVEFE